VDVEHDRAMGAIEEPDRVLASVASEVAVVAVDHKQARAHVAGELERRDSRSKRERGEGVAQVVDPSHRFDAGFDLRWLPVPVTEVAKVEIAAASWRGKRSRECESIGSSSRRT
jgi:hypothetical protein